MLDTRPACFPLTCAVFATDAGGRFSYCCSVLLGSPPWCAFLCVPIATLPRNIYPPQRRIASTNTAPHTAATKTKIKPQAGQKNDASEATRPQLVIVWLPECGYWGAAKMPNLKLLARVCDLRARAEEILAKAESMTDADARDMMRAVAVSYEKLARRLEQKADEA